MATNDDNPSWEKRKEKRGHPNPYFPHAVINPDDSARRLSGYVRNQSDKGFSAQFQDDFPYEEGDIVDVRVSYRRTWAKVVWTKRLTDRITIVGFQLHPEGFLD